MNKTELINAIASKADIPINHAAKALNSMMETIKETLKAGDEIQLIGFGSFKIINRPARTGRNPATGEKINIPPAKVPVFKPGKNLKETCNE